MRALQAFGALGRPRLPARLFGLLAVTLAGLAVAGHDDRALLVGDPLVGLATALVLVRCTRLAASEEAARTSPGLRLLQSRAATALGAVSYSLYLVHYPLLAWADALLRSADASGDARLATHVLATAPLCLVAAWLFHRAFERPFHTDPARATAPSVHVPSPAGRRTNDAPVHTAMRM